MLHCLLTTVPQVNDDSRFFQRKTIRKKNWWKPDPSFDLKRLRIQMSYWVFEKRKFNINNMKIEDNFDGEMSGCISCLQILRNAGQWLPASNCREMTVIWRLVQSADPSRIDLSKSFNICYFSSVLKTYSVAVVFYY